jgi:splicing factor 3A subunit 1
MLVLMVCCGRSLCQVLNIPANKQKISRDNVGFMRDEFSLAFYNVGPDVQLLLGVKERGGRKK